LSSVMQSIDLADRVTITANPDRDGIQLACSRDGLPLDRRNTAWRAADLFLQASGMNPGVGIFIQKRIPASAGLAGGSADAAAVLHALDLLYPGAVAHPELFNIAAQIGADVPFCLRGGTVLCEGIGEKLTPLQPFDGIPLLLCKPDFDLSTTWVFQKLDLSNLGHRPDQPAVIKSLASRDLRSLALSTANVLESVSLPAHPILIELKNKLASAGAAVILMSGSGPTVYGLFGSAALRDEAWMKIAGQVPENMIVIPAATLASGPCTIYNETDN
jgi:4-diphosphocytidyl-2-C-methyl-D-erythritol kinase